MLLEESEGVGVGHHHRRHSVVEQRAQMLHIHGAVFEALHLHHLKSADGGRGGIGAVGTVGHNHLGALQVAAALVVATYHHQSRQLAMGSGKGFEGEGGESRQFAEGMVEQGDQRLGTTGGFGWLQGMEIGKLGHGSHLLVDAGVILHGATAQGIEPVVHTEVVGTVVGVVAHHGQLVALGQLGVGGTAQI